jgi:hypothetical protein
MKKLDTFGKIFSGFAKPGKRERLLLATYVVVIIICAIAVVVLVLSPASSSTAQPPGQRTAPRSDQGSYPSPTPRVTPVPRQTEFQPAPGAEKKPVDFVLVAGPQINCGLTCRQLTPTITNTGDETAHNVCISLVMYNSRAEPILLNGGPYLTQCVGDLVGGESTSEAITINADCGILASKCIRQTLILQTQITSEEKTVQFPDQTISV